MRATETSTTRITLMAMSLLMCLPMTTNLLTVQAEQWRVAQYRAHVRHPPAEIASGHGFSHLAANCRGDASAQT